MMGQKSEYKNEITEVGDGSTNVDIELPAVPDGYKRSIQHVSCEDETTAFTYLRIGYRTRFDVIHWWVEQKNPVAATLYWMRDLKVLQAGDQLLMRFNGTTTSDKVAAYVDGFTEKVNN